MKRSDRKACIKLFLFISVIFAVMIIPYLVTGTAFILGWDMRTIYSSNFENLRTMLAQWKNTGTLPYWSWVNFLGNDFYSSKLFYFNDFWEYFFAFTDLKYTDAIIWMTYLRFLTAGFSFYAYARYNRYSEHTSIIGSLLFTFSAYLLQIMRDPFFASFISFLPLYFLSVDRY
ncbi:MAG: YfhO family protein, partial [Bulleidia sp.]